MAKGKHSWQRRLVTGLCWFIAVQLFAFGPLKFSPVGIFGYPFYPAKFVAWIILVLSAIVALATWPAHWREPFAFVRRESVRLHPQDRKAGVG